jgi:hypothetical protein
MYSPIPLFVLFSLSNAQETSFNSSSEEDWNENLFSGGNISQHMPSFSPSVEVLPQIQNISHYPSSASSFSTSSATPSFKALLSPPSEKSSITRNPIPAIPRIYDKITDDTKLHEYLPGNRIGGLGYFNYDPYNLRFGPGKPIIDKDDGTLRYPQSQWPFITDTLEERYWNSKYGDILDSKEDWRNECWWNGRQSPIDVCEDKVNKECKGIVKTAIGSLKFVLLYFTSSSVID